MATVGDTTGARSCAPIQTHSSEQDDPDPVALLLEVWARQVEAWRALPEHADDLRNPVADMSWGATSEVVGRLRPTTAAGALSAVRYLLRCLRRDSPSADRDYPLPLAERALDTLERLTA